MKLVVDHPETKGPAAVAADPKARERIETARKFLNEYRSSKGLTWKRLSAEIGYEESTVCVFAKDTYPGNPEHVLRAVEQWREIVEDREATVVDPFYVETSLSRRILRALRQTRTRGRLGIIWSESGIGKTTTFRAYLAQNPQTTLLTADPTMGHKIFPLLRRLARALGIDAGRGTNSADVYERIFEYACNSRKLLIVDEAQYLSRESLDLLRCFSETSSTPIVFSGNDQLYEYAFLRGGSSPAAFTQFVSRVSVELGLTRDAITRADVELIAAQVCDLDVTREVGEVLLEQAQEPGALRRLVSVLQRAHEMGHGSVTTAHVAKAVKELTMRKGGRS